MWCGFVIMWCGFFVMWFHHYVLWFQHYVMWFLYLEFEFTSGVKYYYSGPLTGTFQ